MDAEYAGRRYVGIDLHRRRSVIVQMTPEGRRLGAAVRIDNDPVPFGNSSLLFRLRICTR